MKNRSLTLAFIFIFIFTLTSYAGAINIGVIKSDTPVYNTMGTQTKVLTSDTKVVVQEGESKFGYNIILDGYNAFIDPDAVVSTAISQETAIDLGVCKLKPGTVVVESPGSATIIAKVSGEAYGIVRGVTDSELKVELGAFTGYVDISCAEFSETPSKKHIESEEAQEFRNSIVEEAKKYLGIKYVWGGFTTSGFDCSGLVQYIYKQKGIDIPRVARDQCDALTPVGISELLPGDLVFFKKDGNPVHHVGIYVGNGKMIHAPYTGSVVKYETLREGYYREVFYRGGRIIFQ